MRYFGLQPKIISRREKSRALKIFIGLTVPYYTLFFISAALKDDSKSRIDNLQSLPFFIQIIIEGSSFTLKSLEIEQIFIDVDKNMVKNINGENFLKKALQIFIIYAMIQNLMTAFAYVGGIVMYWTTSNEVLYTPINNLSAYISVGIIQGTFTLYCGVLNVFLDQILIALLIFLSYYLKNMRKRLKEKKIENAKEIVEIIMEIKR